MTGDDWHKYFNEKYHPSLHTNAYYDKINKLLGGATYKEDVLDILEFVSNELSSGSFME